MQTISQTYQAEVKIKKSTFLAFICPFNSFHSLLENLKKEHTKATHFVWAYRFLNELHQIIEDKNDDAEPRGTSGLPSLNALRAARLINVAVIVVRYFGGVKLGTGGLIRAYSRAVNAVIARADLASLKEQIELNIDLRFLSRFEHFLNKNKMQFKKEIKANKALLRIDLGPSEKEKFLKFSSDFTQDLQEGFKNKS